MIKCIYIRIDQINIFQITTITSKICFAACFCCTTITCSFRCINRYSNYIIVLIFFNCIIFVIMYGFDSTKYISSNIWHIHTFFEFNNNSGIIYSCWKTNFVWFNQSALYQTTTNKHTSIMYINPWQTTSNINVYKTPTLPRHPNAVYEVGM